MLFCRGANKAFLYIIWFLELFLMKLITVIVLRESLHCSCINFPSILCATSDILLIQCCQWESTLLTVGIIKSFYFLWKVPQFHGNSRYILWCLLQVCASLIQVSVACEYDMRQLCLQGLQEIRTKAANSDWTVIKQGFANAQW